MASHVLENDRLSIVIDDHGAELTRIYDKKNQRDVLWEADPKHWKRHAPLLFPNVGRHYEANYLYNGKTYPSKAHGFARDTDFELLEKTDCSVVHRIVSNEQTRTEYPFDFILEVTQTLLENEIKISWKVINTGDHTMYFTIGGHPAFKVPILPETSYSDYKLLFHTKEDPTYYLIETTYGTIVKDKPYTLPLTNGSFPISDHLFDHDALVFDHELDWAGIGYPDGSPYVSVTCPSFSNFGIWAAPGAPFVCLEPWMGRADDCGFRGELSSKPDINVLKEKETFTASYTITIH
jgi:galactose mutarotase-like enzyme